MNKTVFRFFALIFILSLSEVSLAQNTASAYWELKSDTTLTNLTGQISANDEKFSYSLTDPTLNLKVKDYQSGAGQRMNLGSTLWPKETDENPGRFIVFAVKPVPGNDFIVTSVTLEMGGGGTSTMNANTYYSTDPTFTQKTKLNTSTTLPNSAWLDPSPAYSVNVTVPTNSTFYVLVYPWYNNSPSTSKYIYLRNINISGYTVLSTLTDLTIITSEVSNISFDSAVSGGNVISDGGNAVIERGVCWNETGMPTIAGLKTSDGSGTGSYTSTLTGLTERTKYFVRAYAVTSTDTAYGEETSFTTSPKPMLAFPGAEGYGRFTTGGRGGKVYEVTSLADDNTPGTLRYAINQSGPRIVVFRISGTIFLKSSLSIKNGDLTIAGQTAPGDGVCVAGYTPSINTDNVIVRYMRFRLGDVNDIEDDAFNGRDHKNIIIDHCSMTWSVDEAASFYDNTNFTMQWCIIGESLYHSVHNKGDHGYGGIQGGEGATFHHNLYINNTSRNPRFCGARYHTSTYETEIVDFVNNVVYNWGFNSIYGGELGQQNVRSNYFKPGAATKSSVRNRILNPSISTDPVAGYGKFYVADNFVEGYETTTADNWSTGVQGVNTTVKAQVKVDVPFPIAEVYTETAEKAYQSVLKYVGPNIPKLDSVDARLINEAETGVSTFEGVTYKQTNSVPDPTKITGIIDSQTDVGGWPVLNTLPAPTDSDHDGMPDDWEKSHGLNADDPSDGSLIDQSGYSNVELYLNELVEGNVTDIVTEEEIPAGFRLEQNYPNPFNPSTTIKFSIPSGVETYHSVSLRIFDMLGREIATLVNGEKAPGNYEVKFNGSLLSSGIYFYRLQAGNYSEIKKMILIK